MNRRHFTFSTLLLAAATSSASAFADAGGGAVYAMTNDAFDNEIFVYERMNDGTLTLADIVATEGHGSGGEEPLDPVDALGAQSPLIMSDDGRWLIAVNAGSNQISVFEVGKCGLELTDVVDSGGIFPVSLALHGNLLYVMNSALDGNITGFRLSPVGKLHRLLGSTRSLDAGGDNPPFFLVSPAQVGFTPDGRFLVVTIKGTGEIRLYRVGPTGLPSFLPVVNDSAGTAPFGFSFDAAGHLIVAEPFGGMPPRTGGAGAASSYEILKNGKLRVLSRSVENLQTATCWMTAATNLGFAYATNNGTSAISGYRVDADGNLSLLDASGVTAPTGANPVDLAVTPDNRFLYAVNAGAGTISAYSIDPMTGALTGLGEVDGLPDAGAVGIAAR